MFLFSLKDDEIIQKLDKIYIVPLYIIGMQWNFGQAVTVLATGALKQKQKQKTITKKTPQKTEHFGGGGLEDWADQYRGRESFLL